MKRKIILSVLLSSILFADSMSDALDGFDDTPVVEVSADVNNSMADFNETNISNETETTESLIEGLTGKITEQVAYSYNGDKPHDKFSSLKSSILLDYEHKLDGGWRFKINAKSYYDAIYDIRDETYSKNELKEQHTEVRLYDAYLEGSLTKNIDLKVGRQVVVWGRSDTIRITDILNPLDNRRPGMVDIEDLRLPTSMLKVDYFIKNWRVTPIVIVENTFSISPAFGSAFNSSEDPHLYEKNYLRPTYALSISGEFSGWDIDLYTAHIYDDNMRILLKPKPRVARDKIDMAGVALNVLSGSWLFKTELAYFDKLKYTSTGDKEFSRTDALVGLEYKGFADTMISYDVSLRHFNQYDNRLKQERILKDRDTYQHAFRISSDFMNATLTANYLISLYGKKLDEGGFQRAWVKYELAEGVNTNFGVVDYIGGSTLFDSIKKNDMVFVDISYSF